jgi:hypothetical protein
MSSLVGSRPIAPLEGSWLIYEHVSGNLLSIETGSSLDNSPHIPPAADAGGTDVGGDSGRGEIAYTQKLKILLNRDRAAH